MNLTSHSRGFVDTWNVEIIFTSVLCSACSVLSVAFPTVGPRAVRFAWSLVAGATWRIEFGLVEIVAIVVVVPVVVVVFVVDTIDGTYTQHKSFT